MTEIIHRDCLEAMAEMKAVGRTFASIVTDPPYGLGFMNKHWDAADNVAFRADTWKLALDLLEPGGMLAAFGGSRTQHRMACAIEDAGFEIRDTALWLYGSGFPKSKALLKPAYEPIIIARKPGPLRMLDIDGCRVAINEKLPSYTPSKSGLGKNGIYGASSREKGANSPTRYDDLGRWPANILHDGSDEVQEAFAAFGVKTSGKSAAGGHRRSASLHDTEAGWGMRHDEAAGTLYGDSGTAARFFYCAKTSKGERAGSTHPTVKPLALMRWVVRLINPKGGNVLDPFAGSGTTGVACQAEGFDCTLIERETEYVEIIKRRTENGYVPESEQPLRCDDHGNKGTDRRKSRRGAPRDESLQGSLL